MSSADTLLHQPVLIQNQNSFFKISVIFISIVNGIQCFAEIFIIRGNHFPTFIGLIASFAFLFSPFFISLGFSIKKVILILIGLGAPYLSFRILFTGGVAGATSVWFVLFPVYAVLFFNKKITIYITAYALFFLALTIYLELKYSNFFIPTFESYPHILKINLALTMIASAFFHIFLYQREKAALEKVIKKNQAMLIHSSRLTSVGEMAGAVAHEINTPLSTILFLSQLISEENLKDEVDGEVIQKNLNTLQKVVLNISKISKALLNISRGQLTEGFSQALVGQIIEDVRTLSAHKLKQSAIDFQIQIDVATSEAIYCQPTEILQILVILLNNAHDAIFELEEKWIKLKIFESKNNYFFEIADSGKGIAYDIREKIFEDYFTTKAVGKGTGFGLGIASTLAKKHGGHLIYLDNSPNTVFQLMIPREGNQNGQNLAS